MNDNLHIISVARGHIVSMRGDGVYRQYTFYSYAESRSVKQLTLSMIQEKPASLFFRSLESPKDTADIPVFSI